MGARVWDFQISDFQFRCMKKKQKLDGSVDDDKHKHVVDSPPHEEEEEEDEEVVERHRYRSMAKVAIGYSINPTVENSTITEMAVDMEAKDVFEEEKYDYYDHPSDEEWVRIRTFCKLTGCIYKVAKELFDGDLYSRYGASEIRPLPERLPAPRCFMYMFEDELEEEEEKKPDGYGDFAFFQEYLKFEGCCSREFHESELDSYFKEPVLEWSKDFDALDWWRNESSQYPILSRVARDILSVPISRGTSTRAYVADKRECPEFIVALEGKLLNAMMCGESWPATLIWPSRYFET
ncbi:hypothetical protein HID58_053928 [Brassica napus]|uniref:HAT C-terminal dimerisation domain-containing protein n=1 Tax=Brassica napus TaxID=3708 RepID=A0ABQ8AG16_BRANA|nr:hypothetical protein HID58_053928 [Brassica napus]